ncbi:MAG: hypothetical protein SGI88_18640 [Candidatus Hydrogenedentes bacterium]|nr:hypothetical protein [Candidatus Hydrogenedentota bacterium]
MTKQNPVQHMLKMAGDFVTQQKGKWEHKDWEKFLERAQRAGLDLSDEMKKSLGHMLEASKQFYTVVSNVPDKKKAAAKKSSAKSKAKTKTKAKPKAKAKA